MDDMEEEGEKDEEDTNLSLLDSQAAFILLASSLSETGNLGAPHHTSTPHDFPVTNEG